MVLSKRERYVAIGMLVAVGIWAVDRFAFSRLMDLRNETETEKVKALAELRKAQAVIQHRRALAPKWREMIEGGLKSDRTEAESQVHHALVDWSKEAGLKLSVQTEAVGEKTRLPEISFQASGPGNLKAVVDFLWRIQTATIPIKVTEMQINALKEGADDLNIKFRLSTVYAPRLASPSGHHGSSAGAATRPE